MSPSQRPARKETLEALPIQWNSIRVSGTEEPFLAQLADLVALFDTQRFAELESAARWLLDQTEPCGVIWKLLGAALYMQGKEPMEALQTAARLLPNDAEAHNNLGCALQERGHAQASILSYRQAIAIQPAFLEPHLNLATVLEDTGQLDLAVESYRQALTIDPDDAATHCRLGDLLHQTGQTTHALDSYRKATTIEPDHAPTHMRLGSALRHEGLHLQAAESYRQAIKFSSDSAAAHNNLGIVLRELGQLDDAVASYRRALTDKPDFAEAHSNLGAVQRDLGQLDNAVASCNRAIAITPRLYEAHANLGNALQDLGEFDRAVSCYLRAIDIKPDFAVALSHLGVAWRNLGKLEDAVRVGRLATDYRPHFSEAHNNLGVSLKAQGKLDAAIASFLTAIQHDDQATDAYRNMGCTLQEQGKDDEGTDYLERALALTPGQDKTQYALGLMHLQNGKLKDGWAGYEHRWSGSDKPVKKPAFCTPEWQGESLTHKSLLIWGEQGVGDEIMFASLFGEIIAQAGRCVVACHEKLVPLFAQSFPGIDIISHADIQRGELVKAIDYQCPSGSLARWLRPNQDSFSSHGAYLKPQPERVQHWRNRLNAMGPGLKIGICWRSGYLGGNRYLHYSALSQWGPIFAVKGVHFINLQYDQCDAELAAAGAQFQLPIHAFSEVDLHHDLAEAAALTAAMDLVIGATTASGRLAAALGVPLWALRYGTADWTSLGTDHTPWFPSIQFFSRAWDQDWTGVIERVARQLKRHADDLSP